MTVVAATRRRFGASVTGRYVPRRLLQVIPTVLGVVLTGFLLVHLAPGDPVIALAGEHGDPAYYADMRHRFGLDQSLPRQLLTYASRVAVGDLGVSFVQGRSAAAVVLEHVPATLLLTGTALLLAVCTAIPLGVLAGLKPYGVRDAGVSAAVLGVNAAPVFWVAQLALLVVALGLGIAPVQGMFDAGSDATGLPRALDLLRHLALPALVLASQELAALVRITRSAVMRELGQEYVRTARAKGLRERAVLVRHALPRAMLPVIAVIGSRAAHILAGASVVEIVFGWPGMGRLMLSALQTRDAPVLLAVFLMIASTVVLANLATDLVQAAIDPRIRLG